MLNMLPGGVSKLQVYHLRFHAFVAATVFVTAVEKSIPPNTTISSGGGGGCRRDILYSMCRPVSVIVLVHLLRSRFHLYFQSQNMRKWLCVQICGGNAVHAVAEATFSEPSNTNPKSVYWSLPDTARYRRHFPAFALQLMSTNNSTVRMAEPSPRSSTPITSTATTACKLAFMMAQPLIKAYAGIQGYSAKVMKMITHLPLVPRLRMSRKVARFPQSLGQLHLFIQM
jgi:hypothetical protein